MWGILAVDGGFEVIGGETAIGRRRHLDESAVAALKGFSDRYARLLDASQPAAGLLDLGRALYRWLDGDRGHLTELLQRARPLHVEVCAASRFPSDAEWALLRAPWELLADANGFLAGDAGLGFSPVRRLGRRADAPPLDGHRLGLVFMAASPHGQGARELDYEAEETAIMKAVGATKLDLLVEESGNPGELGDRLNEYAAMQVLHLSCHGHNAWKPRDARPDDKPRPVLMLETPEGAEQPTDADQLIRSLGAHRPRLVFLSACLTAAAGDRRNGLPPAPGGKDPAAGRRGGVAYSLAEAMVNAGLPAVLGWDGSVDDVAATAFAGTLYDRLEGRLDLAGAVADARRDLLNAADERRRDDWHLARLWLGPYGGGPIVGGSLQRRMMPATHGQKEFLDAKGQQVQVASHEEFVGRRRELQAALQALRDGRHAGVLLHGMGRLGKSASRRGSPTGGATCGSRSCSGITVRWTCCRRWRTRWTAAPGPATCCAPASTGCAANPIACATRGPCGQMEAGGTPVLLVIDDLEQILEADPRGGRHRFTRHADVLEAVLRAFDAAVDAGLSRVVITSCYPFTLDGLERRLFERPLPPLSDAAQRKLALRQQEAAADAGLTGAAFDARKALFARVPAIARGNPGLQDLIGRKLVLSPTVPAERAGQTLDEMEAWLTQGDLPTDAGVRTFLENLAVDALLGLAGPTGLTALRDLTLFDLPVPAIVADKLATAAGASLPHLRDLGLVDVLTDMVDRRQPALAVNALAAGRLAPLNDSERDRLARAVTHDLFGAWGGMAGRDKRPSHCDLQLTQLGLLAEDGEVVEGCATDAVIALRRGPAAAAAALGLAAIGLLDDQHRMPPWRLLSETAAAAATVGNGAAADALLERGVAALEEQRRSGASVDPAAALFLVYEQARRLMTRGEPDRAQGLFAEAVRLAEAAGNEISATVARGAVADILYSRGDLDEALRILREELLPSFDRLGDVRSRAVTMGKIADILYRRGDLDEALRIRREEELPVYDRLGDVRSRAVTMGKIADILSSRGDLDEALRILREELLPSFDRLGDVRSRGAVIGQIAYIMFEKKDVAAARVLQQERLEINRRLGDADGMGATLWDLARLDLAEQKIDDAVPRVVEAYDIVSRLGRAEGIAVIGMIFGQILAANDQPEDARTVLQRSADMFLRLGQNDAASAATGLIRQLGLE
jgi:CHAT domain-containing protein/tetratricopeptide (TPR) repeat protein